MPETTDDAGGEAPTTGLPTYDREALYEKLGEVQGYLAELRYIDNALRYIEEQDEAMVTDSLVIASAANAGSDSGATIDMLDVEFGPTFPFTKRYYVVYNAFGSLFSSPTETIRERLEELNGEAAGWAANEVSAVASMMEPFTSVPVAMFDTYVIEPLTGVLHDLQDRVATDFGRLDYSMRDWKGDAAENFASHFYTPFGDTLPSQQRLVSSLIRGVVTTKLIIESTQRSLLSVVTEVREALLEQLELRQFHAQLVREETRRNAWIITSSGVAIVTGLFGSSLWAAALSTAGGAAGIASTTVPDGTHITFEMLGATAEELFTALFDGVRAIDDGYSYQQDELGKETRTALDRVAFLMAGPDRQEGEGRLVPNRPTILDGVDAETFYLPP